MDPVALYTVVHLAFESAREYDNPLWDAQLTLLLTAPSGRTVLCDGYWDGGPTWRGAVSLDELGTWHWHSQCSDATNAGLHGREGTIDCVAYTGDNPLYAHGPLRISADGHHLEHVDGTPFFWLADTAWNGVIRGDDAGWARYLDARAGQAFTAVQFVVPHWRGDREDEAGRTACTEEHPIRIDPEYFRDKDRRIAMVNERGLIAAPVVLWSLMEDDLGYKLPEEDAILLARYIVARYGAYQVVWLLGGDGRYPKMGIDRWRRIGRAVFARKHDRLVTLHPCGLSWIGEEFRGENWYDFIGYQSGHGDGDDQLRWLSEGPPARQWKDRPPKPVINLEPNYEDIPGSLQGGNFNDYHVRRAAYWSCLVSPTAGVTYGHNRIWTWNLEVGPAEGHERLGEVRPWHTAIEAPGIRGMTLLREFFSTLPWWTLRPCPALVSRQPGKSDPKAFVAAAQSEDRAVFVIYTPVGGTLELEAGDLGQAQWFNPRTGAWSEADSFTTPDDGDWLLVMRRNGG